MEDSVHLNDRCVLLLEKIVAENKQLRETIEANHASEQRLLQQLSSKLYTANWTGRNTTSRSRKRRMSVPQLCRVSFSHVLCRFNCIKGIKGCWWPIVYHVGWFSHLYNMWGKLANIVMREGRVRSFTIGVSPCHQSAFHAFILLIRYTGIQSLEEIYLFIYHLISRRFGKVPICGMKATKYLKWSQMREKSWIE